MENHSATSPTPYVVSTEGWALFFHQPWKGGIDLRGKRGIFEKYPAPYCDVFIVGTERPMDAATEYYALTGRPPLPPKFAFGYQQSYRTLFHNGENVVVASARYLREKEIPCDLLIYLGTGYCENGWNTYNGEFAFHPDVFPDPARTMKDLHAMNYKIGFHVTKCFTGLHGSVNDAIEPSPLEYDHAKNYWKRHQAIHAIAKNEAWWPDDADEVDMEQRLNRHRMYYEGSLRLNPNTRPLQMQRNTFPGCTKWGAFIWTGDVHSEWETLKNQVPIGINVGLSCNPYWGSDTGGFYSTAEYDGELFIRWFEYSTFTPIFRSHGRPSFLHNPWGWTKYQSIEEIPFELSDKPRMRHVPPRKDILPDERVEPICKKFVNARYALLPYIYNLAHQAYASGIPLIRPMWFAYPEDAVAVRTGSQYFLGDSLLVAPVTRKGATQWDVYLPEGEWHDYWRDVQYSGGKMTTVDAPLDSIPVFVPAGGIIAKAPVVQYVDTQPKTDFDELIVEVYRGADGRYVFYEDDGISMDYQRGKCSETTISWKDASGTIDVRGTSQVFSGKERTIEIVLKPGNQRQTVRVKYS
jgi:alpha-glucosidase/alpha-D-xyloside xylohydrolase